MLSLPYQEIDIYLEPHVWLKAPVFNFQYRHVVHFKDVSVRSYVDKPDTYLILGKNKEMTIVNKKK